MVGGNVCDANASLAGDAVADRYPSVSGTPSMYVVRRSSGASEESNTCVAPSTTNAVPAGSSEYVVLDMTVAGLPGRICPPTAVPDCAIAPAVFNGPIARVVLSITSAVPAGSSECVVPDMVVAKSPDNT